MISESERNPDKLYFYCAKCRYFEWYSGEEEEVTSRRNNLNAERGQVNARNGDGIPVRQVAGPKQFLIAGALGNALIIINLTLLAVFIFIQIVKSIR